MNSASLETNTVCCGVEGHATSGSCPSRNHTMRGDVALRDDLSRQHGRFWDSRYQARPAIRSYQVCCGDAVSLTALKMAAVILPGGGHRVNARRSTRTADGQVRPRGNRLGCYPSLKAHTRRTNSDRPAAIRHLHAEPIFARSLACPAAILPGADTDGSGWEPSFNNRSLKCRH